MLLDKGAFSGGRRTGFQPEIAFPDINELRIGVETCFVHAGLLLPLFEGLGNAQPFPVKGAEFAADILVFQGGPEHIAFRMDLARDADEKHGGIGLLRHCGTVENVVGDRVISGTAPEDQTEKPGIEDTVPVKPDILGIAETQRIIAAAAHIVFQIKMGARGLEKGPRIQFMDADAVFDGDIPGVEG